MTAIVAQSHLDEPARLDRTARDAGGQNPLSAVFAGWLFFYMATFSALRDYPAIGLGSAVIAALALVLIDRRIYGPALVPLLLLSLLYVGLSYQHDLPRAWTRHFMPSFILRHWMWVPL